MNFDAQWESIKRNMGVACVFLNKHKCLVLPWGKKQIKRNC
jgi:hypothetical protein